MERLLVLISLSLRNLAFALRTGTVSVSLAAELLDKIAADVAGEGAVSSPATRKEAAYGGG